MQYIRVRPFLHWDCYLGKMNYMKHYPMLHDLATRIEIVQFVKVFNFENSILELVRFVRENVAKT